MKQITLLWILAGCAGQIAAGSGLTVEVKRGEGMMARAGEFSPSRIEVVVRGEGGKPVRNATVTFSLPRDGVAGAFSSGLAQESVLTGGEGTASVAGINWGDRPGVALIRVKASREGETGEAVVTVEVRPGQGETRSLAGRSGGKKWILAAAAAGAVLAGVALSGGQGGGTASTLTAQAPASTAPTLGMPSISIGKP